MYLILLRKAHLRQLPPSEVQRTQANECNGKGARDALGERRREGGMRIGSMGTFLQSLTWTAFSLSKSCRPRLGWGGGWGGCRAWSEFREHQQPPFPKLKRLETLNLPSVNYGFLFNCQEQYKLCKQQAMKLL